MSSPCAPRLKLALAMLALAVAGGSAHAQALGSAFTYQGQLQEADAPATGLYDFQFCVYDVAAGSSPLLCAPEFADVPVDGGLFAVAVDFGATMFIGQQRFLELRVRPGASAAAYTPLAPRQLVRATPEALRASVASAAPWLGLTGVPAGFADGVDNSSGGTVTTVNAGAGLTGGPITTSGTLAIAPAGVVAPMIAIGAVGVAQLAINSVDSGRIVDDSVFAGDIGVNAIGASELGNNAVDTAAILDAQVTAPKIAPGAIGAAQIDPTQVQARVGGSCGDGEYFRGIDPDGGLDCELLPVAFDRVLDLVGEVGTHVALALRADQRPLLAYHDEGNDNLKLYDCADAACASGTRRLLDSAGDVGENIAIAIRPGGLPAIAYRSVDAQSLKFYDCTNAACSTGTARTLDDVVNVGAAVAMGLRADGRPLIAYADLSNFRLRIYDCANAGCSSGTALAPPGTSNIYGASIAMRADDRALIALGGNAGAGLPVRVYDCGNIGCTTGTSRNLTDMNFSGPVALAIRTNGRPLVASAGIASSLSVHDCADAVCVASTRAIFDSGTTNAVGMALRGDGRALIVFGMAAGATDLRVLDCGNAGCSAGSSRSLVAGGNFGTYAALALRDDGRPVIAHYDAANDDLRLRICANPDCS
jgi:hypothetical protein